MQIFSGRIMNKQFTVGFIGLGLIGGSIAKALKYYYPDAYIMAHTRSTSTTDYALSGGIIHEAYADINENFSRCDYIFLCAPVETNAACLPKLKPYLKETCILTDVGSTKCDIHQHVKKLLPEYMLPERGIHLDAMPYNLNGKIDRNKLKNYL